MRPKETRETTGSKRKAGESAEPPAKKTRQDVGAGNGATNGQTAAERVGIVDRTFYPPEMTSERCREYNDGSIERPIETLARALEETGDAREKHEIGDAVVMWFKCDLRTRDNKALHLASEKAKTKGVPLICIYIISPQDFEAHITSPARVDFILRSLEVLRGDLAKLDVPLYVETVARRKKLPQRIFDLCGEWGASHLYANVEYEVDELRREASMVRDGLERGVAVTAVPDTCVVAPGELSTGAGKQYSVYTPWFRAWLRYLADHPHHLKTHPQPSENPPSARERFPKLFDSPVPDAPANKRLSDGERKRFKALWPAGEDEAQERLRRFLAGKVGAYKDERNFPAANSTAVLSVHFASGTLSARTAVAAARDANSTKKLDGGNPGIANWISEVAWRDFYKHVLAHWPYVCMNKPFKPEYTDIEWEYNEEHFRAWCEGRTGFPIVDAAMRQMNETGYMHNRCRMIVASFLAKDLLLDWRMGERYFMAHLIDGDFASNNGGWGFSASTGVDPQPYFRIFNPLNQSERFDQDGEYIRKWVPELRDVKDKAIHVPYERGAGGIAKKNGYPKPIVEHKASRGRALERYKAGLKRDTT